MKILIIFIGVLLVSFSRADETPTKPINETENRLAVCLLLYYYRWNQMENLDIMKPENASMLEDIKYKAKAMILDKCYTKMDQELINSVKFYLTKDC